jgi:DNA-binding beta-propeller fold protein YncE
MSGSVSRLNVVAGLVLLALLPLAACSAGGAAAPAAKTAAHPERILAAPKGVLAAGQPQSNGAIWTLAGSAASRGLFEVSLTSGRTIGSISVSKAAQSVTESLTGVLGLALGTSTAGALELLNGGTGAITRTVPLGAPARQVVVGADGATFYVLNGSATSASVTIVDSADGRVQGTVPVPLDTVSIVPDVEETTLYALQPSGRVSQIAVAGGKIVTSFPIGASGRSLALSPDGGTLYVLKDRLASTNVAVVDLATESVLKVLPTPSNCIQVLVSASGGQLYQVVGTLGYGNIQVFSL